MLKNFGLRTKKKQIEADNSDYRVNIYEKETKKE